MSISFHEVNPVQEKRISVGGQKNCTVFSKINLKNGINVTIRRNGLTVLTRACGQLRIKHRDNHKENENENIFSG